jgi:hypothetical protein
MLKGTARLSHSATFILHPLVTPRADCVFVDVFFLRIVETHQSLDRFNDALSISD